MDDLKGFSHRLSETIFIAVTAVSIQKSEKLRARFLEILLQKLVHRLLFQEFLLHIVADFEIRLDVNDIEVAADDLQRKSVKRADVCKRKQVKLAFQRRSRTRIFCDFLLYCGLDFLLHFGSRCVRKGDNQHFVDTAPIL